jgi:lipocalin-like protein
MNRSTRRTKVQRGGMPGAVPAFQMDAETGEIFLPIGQHPEGLILYTPDGYMSAQLSSPEPHNFASGDMYHGTPEEYVAAGTSYLAYSGPYCVDEARWTVDHEMYVSLFLNWKGQRQVRIVKLNGDELQLSTGEPTLFNGSLKTATIIWLRARANICLTPAN